MSSSSALSITEIVSAEATAGATRALNPATNEAKPSFLTLMVICPPNFPAAFRLWFAGECVTGQK